MDEIKEGVDMGIESNITLIIAIISLVAVITLGVALTLQIDKSNSLEKAINKLHTLVESESNVRSHQVSSLYTKVYNEAHRKHKAMDIRVKALEQNALRSDTKINKLLNANQG